MNTSQIVRGGVIAVLATAVLAACATPGGTAADPSDESLSSEASKSEALPSMTTPMGAPDGIPAAVWDGVLADLATRVGDGVVDPTVVSAQAMTWNDGAWGCPEEGMMYTQALVEGFQVVVEVNGEEFDYRSDGRSVRFCDPASMIEGGG
jgi:hypothetical protein